MLTQQRLKELLHYNPDTGNFTWLVDRASSKVKGKIAGYIDSDGYRRISIYPNKYKAHRLVWLYVYGKWPKDQIDHINGIRSDNSFINLRDVNPSDNSKNIRLMKSNKSRVSGVSYHKQSNKWRSDIGLKDKQIYLGLFENKFEAICARKSAENKYGYHENHGRY